MFSVLTGYINTRLYLEAVREASDSNREALGFLPSSVFDEFARKDQLYILLSGRQGQATYAGHILFDCQYPRAIVRQIHTVTEVRGAGGARFLLERLKEDLTTYGFTSIYARVAEDLAAANAFWQKQGFRVQRVESGGATRNRRILVRCLELPSRQLFPSSGVDPDNPLGLIGYSDPELPLYLVDLNVLYDLGPRRLRHAAAAALFAAERMNFCRLAISKELGDELQRTAPSGRTDPMADYVRIYPAFPLTRDSRADDLLRELARTIFPRRESDADLTDSERSDLRHVATAVQHRLAGFITSDQAILNAAPEIYAKHGVQIVSTAAFQAPNGAAPPNIDFDIPSDQPLRLLPISTQDEQSVHDLLADIGLSGSAISSRWLSPSDRFAVALGYGIWNATSLVG